MDVELVHFGELGFQNLFESVAVGLESVAQRLSLLPPFFVLARLKLEFPNRYFKFFSRFVDELGNGGGVLLFAFAVLLLSPSVLFVFGLFRMGFVVFDLFGEEVDGPA